MNAEGGPEGAAHIARRSERRRRAIWSSSAFRRFLYALIAIAICEIVGSAGFHLLEGFNWVDAVYEESMLATGQGPSLALAHNNSKLFASVMGFVSVGSTFTTITLGIAPFLARLWHEARVAAEKDVRKLEEELTEKLHRRKEGTLSPEAPETPGHRPPSDGPGGP